MPLPLKELYKTVSNPHPVALDELAEQGGIAHVCIDVQAQFCDKDGWRGTDDTEQTAKRIAKLSSLFRRHGIPNIWVYFDHDQEPSIDRAGFHHVVPEPHDILIPKDDDSAFDGSNIHSILKEQNIKTLLVTGVNLNSCVHATVVDARKEKYNVIVLTDAVGNDNCGGNSDGIRPERVKSMHKKGAAFAHSATVFNQLKNGQVANQNNKLSRPVQQANETNDKTHSSTALRLAKLLPFVPFLLG
jgi:hypothetical protein